MTAVVCIKAGPKYPTDYANKLFRAVRRNGHAGRFYCLTDDPSGLERDIIALPVSPLCQGWWHKIYLFSWDHGIDARLLYMDIDMVVTGSLEDFLGYDGAFATGSRFNKPNEINSTIMSIPAGYGRGIWTTFLRFRSRAMRSFRLDFGIYRSRQRTEDRCDGRTCFRDNWSAIRSTSWVGRSPRERA